MPRVSVIIRTKNEEAWIGRCLKAVFDQTHKDLEVILVDNRSTDHTVEIARRFPIKEVVTLDQFRPGLSINEGIRRSTGEYLACLSAHCVPQHDRWLENLLRNFSDPKVAGVYGRQLPLAFSEASDKRDLLITFGLDRRVQVKDYFFHNANSMFRRDRWEAVPFDEQATNIEDRIWGKAIIEAGYQLVYEPEAQVYHHHGIHQDNDPNRARSTVSVLERFDEQASRELPGFLKPENIHAIAVVPVLGEPRKAGDHDLLKGLLEQFKSSSYIKQVYVLSEQKKLESVASAFGSKFILRPQELCSSEKTLEDALRFALAEIEKSGSYPEVILNANYLYPFRPARLFDELIQDIQSKGLETVFAGYTDYNNIWVVDPKGGFAQVGEGLKSRDRKQPVYEALYGVGSATASHVIRAGRLVGDRVGILPLTDRLYTLKCVDADSVRLIEAALRLN